MQLSSPGDTTETCKPQCASTFCVQRPVLQTFVVQNPAVQTFCQAEACCAKCCFARQGMGLICRPATYAKSCCARTCCATQGMKWYAGGGRPNMLCTGRPVYCAWCHISVNMRMVCRRWQVTYATYWQACILCLVSHLNEYEDGMQAVAGHICYVLAGLHTVSGVTSQRI